jgi:hypothetical protein
VLGAALLWPIYWAEERDSADKNSGA